MKNLKFLLPVLAILLMAANCTTKKECCSEYKDCEKSRKACNTQLIQTKEKHQQLQLNYINLVQRYDSVTGSNDSNFINCVTELDSLRIQYDQLSTSWIMLVGMYDSLLKIPPDTVVWIPQCTLCYQDTVNINGIQYYVGYDGKHYRLYQDEDTVIRQVFYKDTTVIRYVLHDSVPDPMERALIIIDAAGSECEDDWPILNVEVNGVPVKDIKVGKTHYNQYWFNVMHHEYNIDSIRVSFGNDCYVESGGDRNCFVKSVMINYHEYLLKENTDLSGHIWWHDTDPHTIIMLSNGSFLIESYKTNGQYY